MIVHGGPTRSRFTRQRARRALLILSLLLFPITMNYMSPYLIVDGAFSGVLVGSGLLFGLLFISALFFGRGWCGWACPMAGLQEAIEPVNPQRVSAKWRAGKWVVWIPWVALVAVGFVVAGGVHGVQPFYGTVSGISVAGDTDRPVVYAFVIYLAVVGTFFALAAVLGRRGGCHALCWMAPFMVIGRGIRNRVGSWLSLRLVAESDRCTSCGTCTIVCPMSIDVRTAVAAGQVEQPDCALCASCADACPSRVLSLKFLGGR